MENNQSEFIGAYYDIAASCMEKSYKRVKPFMSFSTKANKGKGIRKILIAVFIGIALLGTGTAAAVGSLCVTDVWSEEGIVRVVSFSTDEREIVERSGTEFTENDALILDLFFGEGKNNIIIVAKPHTVKIYRDGKYLKEVTAAGSVENALKKAQVKLKEGDVYSPYLNSTITEDSRIDITSGFVVTIKADSQTKKIGFAGGTVRQALLEAGITLSDDDIISPAPEKVLKKKTTVTVKRVTFEENVKTLPIEYESVIKYDDTMYEDESKTQTKGKDGKKKVYYLTKFVDGVEEQSVPFKVETIKEAKNKVTVKGTKKRPLKYVSGTRVFSEITPPFPIELDESNRPVKYEKIITGKATAYCGGGITATGQKAMPGRIAVNPRQIPYGTKMYVVSSDGKWVYGYCVASDTGGFVKKRSAIADLYMHSYNDCMQFGRRNVDIYILEWG